MHCFFFVFCFYKNNINLIKAQAKPKNNNNFYFSKIILRKRYRFLTKRNQVLTITASRL